MNAAKDPSSPPVSYAELTVQHRSWLGRFSHRARFDLAQRLLAPQAGEHVLDYGAGDAYLLCLMHARQPQARYSAYEPYPAMAQQARARLQAQMPEASLFCTREELQNQRCDKLVCCEVLEHLQEQELAQVFADFRQLLDAQGRLLLSVPVEVGPVALVKHLVRMRGAQARRTPLRHVLAATFGRVRELPRPAQGRYIYAHLGFDHRALRRRLAQEGFVIETEHFSPLPWLRDWGNSQVFWLCRKA